MRYAHLLTSTWVKIRRDVTWKGCKISLQSKNKNLTAHFTDATQFHLYKCRSRDIYENGRIHIPVENNFNFGIYHNVAYNYNKGNQLLSVHSCVCRNLISWTPGPPISLLKVIGHCLPHTCYISLYHVNKSIPYDACVKHEIKVHWI